MKTIINPNRIPLTMLSTGPLFMGCVKLAVMPGGGVRPGSWKTAGFSRESGEIDGVNILKKRSSRDVMRVLERLALVRHKEFLPVKTGQINEISGEQDNAERAWSCISICRLRRC